MAQLMYHESYSYLTKGLELLNKESSDDIELQLSYYETAGKVAVRLADYEKAITHYQSAITTIENSGQDFSERLATIYDKLGGSYAKKRQNMNRLWIILRKLKILLISTI